MPFAGWFGKGRFPFVSHTWGANGEHNIIKPWAAGSPGLRGAPHEREGRRRGRRPGVGGAPAMLQGVDDGLVHGWAGVAVDAADAGDAVAEAAGLGDFGDAVFDEQVL